ncbi:GNAT family N-acetyltransferase [Phreatobacter stygius]|uniref:GNAT family N-acetyltransferase n=1 Tax=Phreatobacter stygius TaxID=1940610 RepID=A0A4D7B9U1_9HYPH|nr:GNAT family N-acetyltransferase [Phreatobacter stygius]QCI66928.1 GNAT family N-acetyltransferase [Phreatobacter stygius]
MAPTEPITVERLDAAALAAACSLSQQAGWNQTAEDWRIFFDQGAVFGAPAGAAPVATGAVLPFGSFGWISMVLVSSAERGKGLGTAVLRRCMAELAALDCLPVLDATPQGERIYAPLGFLPQLPLWRWRGEGLGPDADDGGQVDQADPEALGAIVAIDAKAFGAPRRQLLAGLMQRAPAQALVLKNGKGFVLARPGRQALQIGPLVAPDEASALALLKAALGRAEGPVILDVPAAWQAIAAHLTASGFRQERPYLRMALGRSAPFGDPMSMFVIAGPELG